MLPASQTVLVQPEIERVRSPLMSVPPCGRGFKASGPTDPMRLWKQRKKLVPALPPSSPMSPPDYPSAWFVSQQNQLSFRPARWQGRGTTWPAHLGYPSIHKRAVGNTFPDQSAHRHPGFLDDLGGNKGSHSLDFTANLIAHGVFPRSLILVVVSRCCAGAALHNCPVEQSFGKGRHEQETHAATASRLTENRHAARVAAERANVPLHPLKSRDLIEQAIVARDAMSGLLRKLGIGEKAERTQAVVNVHENDALLRQFDPAAPAAPTGESASVEPDHHGTSHRRSVRQSTHLRSSNPRCHRAPPAQSDTHGLPQVEPTRTLARSHSRLACQTRKQPAAAVVIEARP